jgi:hypothetical protein
MHLASIGAALGLVALAGGAAPAKPLPAVRLEYSRVAEAQACPDEAAIRGAVAAQVGTDPFREPAELVLRAVLTSEGGILKARVEAITAGGEPRGSRELVSRARNCAELASAVEFAISVTIDPLCLAEPASPATPQPPVDPTPAPSNQAELPPSPEAPLQVAGERPNPAAVSVSPPALAGEQGAPAAEPPPAVVEEQAAPAGEPPPAEVEEQAAHAAEPPQPGAPAGPDQGAVALPAPTPPSQLSSQLEVAVHAGALVSFGSAPSTAFGVGLGVEARLPRFQIGLEARGDFPASAAYLAGQVKTTLFMASLVPCVRLGPAGICVLGSVGAVVAGASGYPTVRESTTPYTTVGGRAFADLAVAGPVSIRFQGDLSVVTTRTTLRVDGEPAWAMPLVGGALGVGGCVLLP